MSISGRGPLFLVEVGQRDFFDILINPHGHSLFFQGLPQERLRSVRAR